MILPEIFNRCDVPSQQDPYRPSASSNAQTILRIITNGVSVFGWPNARIPRSIDILSDNIKYLELLETIYLIKFYANILKEIAHESCICMSNYSLQTNEQTYA